MSSHSTHTKRLFKRALLLVGALLLTLTMLRLGVWQLDRASEKQVVLDQQRHVASQAAQDLDTLLESSEEYSKFRFRAVVATGQFVKDSVFFLDNQVVDQRVGVDVFALFETTLGRSIVMRLGWSAHGQSRAELPTIVLPSDVLTLSARLNSLPSLPPLWDDRYAPYEGRLWQGFESQTLSDVLGRPLVPMMLELPASESQRLVPQVKPKTLRQLDDKWVGQHKAYALQWFAMAIVFLLACLILMIRSLKRFD